jgi:hypothetical protein
MDNWKKGERAELGKKQGNKVDGKKDKLTESIKENKEEK